MKYLSSINYNIRAFHTCRLVKFDGDDILVFHRHFFSLRGKGVGQDDSFNARFDTGCEMRLKVIVIEPIADNEESSCLVDGVIRFLTMLIERAFVAVSELVQSRR